MRTYFTDVQIFVVKCYRSNNMSSRDEKRVSGQEQDILLVSLLRNPGLLPGELPSGKQKKIDGFKTVHRPEKINMKEN